MLTLSLNQPLHATPLAAVKKERGGGGGRKERKNRQQPPSAPTQKRDGRDADGRTAGNIIARSLVPRFGLCHVVPLLYIDGDVLHVGGRGDSLLAGGGDGLRLIDARPAFGAERATGAGGGARHIGLVKRKNRRGGWEMNR